MEPLIGVSHRPVASRRSPRQACNVGSVTHLAGRGSERDVLDHLIGALRAGESGALVVSGEPGVGKTALLEYAVEQAKGCRVLHTAGVQSEMELAFAGFSRFRSAMRCRRRSASAPGRPPIAF
jgi:hypothetical protein